MKQILFILRTKKKYIDLYNSLLVIDSFTVTQSTYEHFEKIPAL